MRPCDYSARARATRHPGARSSIWQRKSMPGGSGSAGRPTGNFGNLPPPPSHAPAKGEVMPTETVRCDACNREIGPDETVYCERCIAVLCHDCYPEHSKEHQNF